MSLNLSILSEINKLFYSCLILPPHTDRQQPGLFLDFVWSPSMEYRWGLRVTEILSSVGTIARAMSSFLEAFPASGFPNAAGLSEFIVGGLG